MLGQEAGIIGEIARKIAVGPASKVLKFWGEIPVIDRAERADAGISQRIGEPLVIVQAFGLSFPFPLGSTRGQLMENR